MSNMNRQQRNSTRRHRLLTTAILSLMAIPLLAGIASQAGSTAAPVLDVSVTNNSSREIHHLYISPADRNEWGPDLLDGRIIKPGESATVNTVCPSNEIKLIAEDKAGCFMYQPASCTQSVAEWTVTNQTPVDCGTED